MGEKPLESSPASISHLQGPATCTTQQAIARHYSEWFQQGIELAG